MLLDPRTADPFGAPLDPRLDGPRADRAVGPRAARGRTRSPTLRAAGFTVAALTPGDDAIPIDAAAGDGTHRAAARRRGPRAQRRGAGGERTCACGSRWRPASTRSTSPPPARSRSTASLRQSRNERRLHRGPRRPRLVRAARRGARGTPVLTLHGGPGAGPLLHPAVRRAAGGDRPVILYDQLGCGLSEKPDDPSLWTFDRSVDELDAGARRARARALPPVRAVVGRLAGDRVPVRAAGGHRAGDPGHTSASIQQFTGEARRLIERAAGAGPHHADRARRPRRVRPPRLPGGRAGLLPAPPLPARPVAGGDAARRPTSWTATRST